MSLANKRTYLTDITEALKIPWPDNRTLNIVCHGHSVPAGYFGHFYVDTFNAYPHLFHHGLKDRFSVAVINVIVTAIGGETSDLGAERFERDVLCHGPKLVIIDYGLNDRRIGVEKAEASWRLMIESALARGIKLVLLTPTHDNSLVGGDLEQWNLLGKHAEQIRSLAHEYGVGLVDSFALFEKHTESGGDLTDLLSWANHPNRTGHELVAQELLRWFPVW